MMDIKPFAGLSQEETAQFGAWTLAKILDAMPMKDVLDQMRVSGNVGVIGAVSSVTTVGSVTNMAQIGSAPANTSVGDLMNIAAASHYDLWKVGP